MSDEPLAAEPAPNAPSRATMLVGGGAFLIGMLLTAALFHLTRLPDAAPAPTAAPVAATAPAQPASAPALPPGTDIATLNAREQELAGKLDQLELRLRDVDGSARNASSYATRAERLMIASAVRRAIERGQPLGPLEAQLRRRFGGGEAVAAILRAAAQPVTLEDLRLALDTIAPRLMSGPSDSLWTQARRMLGDLIVVRQAGTPSPRAIDRLRRARRTLEQGDPEAALAEVVHMPGVANAESWVSAARRYIAARQGLSEIERAALDAPPATPPIAAAPARPAGT